MQMPSYVNVEALMTDQELDKVLMQLPSAVLRGRVMAHAAVTNAVLKELGQVLSKEREHIASWLDGEGGVYALVAKAIREGSTPTLDQPPRGDAGVEAKLREELTEAVQQRDALQAEVDALRGGNAPSCGGGAKPADFGCGTRGGAKWGVRGRDGLMTYYDTRAAARRDARVVAGESRVMDLR